MLEVAPCACWKRRAKLVRMAAACGALLRAEMLRVHTQHPLSLHGNTLPQASSSAPRML